MARCLIVLFLVLSTSAFGQNNFVHIGGYKTGELGEIPLYTKTGSGEEVMIIIPGWGLDKNTHQPVIDKYRSSYTVYSITIPGFGDTKAPAMPENVNQFNDLYWTQGVIDGLLKLIEKEELENVTLFASFMCAPLIAMRLALDHPDKVKKVVIMSGSAKFVPQHPSQETRSLKDRISVTEDYVAKNWFKTLSRETWDEGNFPAVTYSKDSVRAKTFWDKISSVPMPIMIRYLCEFYCTDFTLEYRKLKVPTLVVIPSFTNPLYKDVAYIRNTFHDSWRGSMQASSNILLVTIPESNMLIDYDQPEQLFKSIDLFFSK